MDVLGLGARSAMKHVVARIGYLLRQGVVVLLCQLRLSSIVGNIRDGSQSWSKVNDKARRGSNLLAFSLGGSGLAILVEVVYYGWKYVYLKLQDLFVEVGCVAKLRTKGESGEPFEIDNKNNIMDLKVTSDSILRIARVVEHWIFLDVTTTVIVVGELGVTVKNK